MSTFERTAIIIGGVLLLVMLFFSYHELREPNEQAARREPNFEQSLGNDFTIGPYTSVVSQRSSGGREDNCEALKPVLLGTLHDIKERLERQNALDGSSAAFEVNETALDLLCNKNAEITLADKEGNTLLLRKEPFVRAVPPGGSPADIGTDVRIDATVTRGGSAAPTQQTTFGESLIPDRYLDAATSSRP